MAKYKTQELYLLYELLKLNAGLKQTPSQKDYEFLAGKISGWDQTDVSVPSDYLYRRFQDAKNNLKNNAPETGIDPELLQLLLESVNYESIETFRRDLQLANDYCEKVNNQIPVLCYHPESNIVSHWDVYKEAETSDKFSFRKFKDLNDYNDVFGQTNLWREESNFVIHIISSPLQPGDEVYLERLTNEGVIFVNEIEEIPKDIGINMYQFYLILLFLDQFSSKTSKEQANDPKNYIHSLNNSGVFMMQGNINGENISMGDFNQTNHISKSDSDKKDPS